MGALIAIVVLLALAASAGASPGGGGGTSDVSHKAELWNKLRSIPELDDTQRYLLMLIAAGESGYRPTAHNSSPGEVTASRRALDNNPVLAVRLAQCGGNWAQGSGGLFGRLFPYFGDDMLRIFESCTHARPELVYDSDYAIVSAIRTARRLQGYNTFIARPTVGTVRLGWASPGLMAQPQDQTRLARYRKRAEDEGFPDGIVDAVVRVFPGNYSTIFERLRGVT